MTGEQLKLLLRVIDILAISIRLIPELRQAYEDSTDTLRAVIGEKRNPTEEEWRELNEKIEELHSKFSAS